MLLDTKKASVQHLFVEEIQSQLEPNGPHVILLQRSRHVHVHVKEALHGAALLRLLNLQLGQQVDEPLERALVAVDPEEVDLGQAEHVSHVEVSPAVLTVWALALVGPESVHDGLQDGREGSDADAGCDQDGVLRPEDVAGRGAKGTINEDLQNWFI